MPLMSTRAAGLIAVLVLAAATVALSACTQTMRPSVTEIVLDGTYRAVHSASECVEAEPFAGEDERLDEIVVYHDDATFYHYPGHDGLEPVGPRVFDGKSSLDVDGGVITFMRGPESMTATFELDRGQLRLGDAQADCADEWMLVSQPWTKVSP